ncbi:MULTISPECIES: hypothetical protein [unclassified Frankia]|uniref:hypothetical protein n=2 Tax=Frankia TaxID=1854 RepID=UPI001A477480|nr:MULTISPECIES: hypothetical protein [unclassified Frankia]MBL7487207.1 hypothetical protein [Frankia sp. AgW1.1]MBL7623924.1 hypothetical protein [Frankia sp. AgB1.8]
MEPWEDLVEAENAFIAARMRLFKVDIKSQLRQALGTRRGRATALRVLHEGPESLTMDLIDDVFDAAIGATDDILFARDALRRVDPGWLAIALRPLIARHFMEPTEPIDWLDYRCVADLLDDLKQINLLNIFIKWASEVDDPEVQDVVDDYRDLPGQENSESL